MKDNKSFYKQLGRFVKDVSNVVRSNAPRYKTLINEKTKKVGKKGIRMVDLQIVRSKLNAAYQQLGQSFYQESSQERLRPFSKQVKGLVETIKSLQFEMESLSVHLPEASEEKKPPRKQARPGGASSASKPASKSNAAPKRRGRPPGKPIQRKKTATKKPSAKA